MITRVYIAGPYSKPDPVENTHLAVEVADRLSAVPGIVPYIPHLSLFWHYHSPKPYVWWLEYDVNWVDVCDCVLRIPGLSAGADDEVRHAMHVDKLVFFSEEGVIEWHKKRSG